jgi:murein DD-endopeptidase MepM/ murein hydrolase activator NlpD
LDILQLLTSSCFTESLINKNALKGNKFKEWIFSPGMLFGSIEKWWDAGKRDKPHEGLDLCFYADLEQKILHFTEDLKIPAIFNGVVAGIIEDFLGKSIIIKHNISAGSGRPFFSIYGHVIPERSINEGTMIRQGDVIALLAGTGKSKAKIFPHLHVSLGFIIEGIPFRKLNWDTVGDPKIFSLLDPMQIIGHGYSVIDYYRIKKLIDI